MSLRNSLTLLILSFSVASCGGGGSGNSGDSPSPDITDNPPELIDPVSITFPSAFMMVDDYSAPFTMVELVRQFHMLQSLGHIYTRTPNLSENQDNGSIHYWIQTDENGDGSEIISLNDHSMNGATYNGQIRTEFSWSGSDPYYLSATITYAQYSMASDSYNFSIDGTLTLDQFPVADMSIPGISYVSNLYIREPDFGLETIAENLAITITPDDLMHEVVEYTGAFGFPDLGYFNITSDGDVRRETNKESIGLVGDGRIVLHGKNGSAIHTPSGPSFLMGELVDSGEQERYYRIDQDLVWQGSVLDNTTVAPLPMNQGGYIEALTGVPALLDASGSVQPEGRAFTVEWSVASAPHGEMGNVLIDSPHSLKANATFPVDGHYTIRLLLDWMGVSETRYFHVKSHSYGDQSLDMSAISGLQLVSRVQPGETVQVDTRASRAATGEAIDDHLSFVTTQDHGIDAPDMHEDQDLPGLYKSTPLERGFYYVGYGDANAVIVVGDMPIEFDRVEYIEHKPRDASFYSSDQNYLRDVVENHEASMVRANTSYSGNPELSYFESDGESIQRVSTIQFPQFKGWPLLADVNGDGIDDAASGGENDCLGIHAGVAEGFSTDYIPHESDRVCSVYGGGNLLGEGGAELIVRDHNASPIFYMADFNADYSLAQFVGIPDYPRYDPLIDVIDFDGDGRDELVFASDCSLTIWNLESDGSLTSSIPAPDISQCLSERMAIVDINGDGYMDVLAMNEFPYGYTILYQNHDGFDRVDSRDSDGFGGGDLQNPMLVTDINSDGVDDVLTISTSGTGELRINVLEGASSDIMTAEPEVMRWQSVLPPSSYRLKGPPVMIDVDNDGLKDLLLSDGDLFLLLRQVQ